MKYVNISVDILSASPQYKKGDRVIANFNTSKDPEYYVGTVTGIRKGLVYIVFDDGDKHSFKPTRSLVGLVGITKSKKKRKSEILSKDINKWLDIDIGKAKPKRTTKTNMEIPSGLVSWVKDYKEARKTGNISLAKGLKKQIDKKIKELKLNPDDVYGVKDYFEKKKFFFNTMEFIIHNEDLDFVLNPRNKPKKLTESIYPLTPLGRKISTGRANEPFAITIAINGRYRMVGLTPISNKILSFNAYIDDREVASLMQNKQVSWSEYLKYYKKAYEAASKYTKKVSEREKESLEKEKKFKLGWSTVGKEAKILWSDGKTSWKEVLDISRNQKFAVSGSGKKRRWLPYSMIIDIRD